MADPILYQEKGVFYANVVELIRAHQALCNRFLALESKPESGEGSDVSNLERQVQDLSAALTGQGEKVDALVAKVNVLFPDENPGNPPAE